MTRRGGGSLHRPLAAWTRRFCTWRRRPQPCTSVRWPPSPSPPVAPGTTRGWYSRSATGSARCRGFGRSCARVPGGLPRRTRRPAPGSPTTSRYARDTASRSTTWCWPPCPARCAAGCTSAASRCRRPQAASDGAGQRRHRAADRPARHERLGLRRGAPDRRTRSAAAAGRSLRPAATAQQRRPPPAPPTRSSRWRAWSRRRCTPAAPASSAGSAAGCSMSSSPTSPARSSRSTSPAPGCSRCTRSYHWPPGRRSASASSAMTAASSTASTPTVPACPTSTDSPHSSKNRCKSWSTRCPAPPGRPGRDGAGQAPGPAGSPPPRLIASQRKSWSPFTRQLGSTRNAHDGVVDLCGGDGWTCQGRRSTRVPIADRFPAPRGCGATRG